MHLHKELKNQGRELFHNDAAPTPGETTNDRPNCFTITTREHKTKRTDDYSGTYHGTRRAKLAALYFLSKPYSYLLL